MLPSLPNSCSVEVPRWWVLPLMLGVSSVQFSSFQSLSRVQLFETPWITACQASLSIINSQSPPKPASIESVMPSNHLILCRPLLLLPLIFPSIRSSMSQLFASGGQSIGVSALTSVLPMNTQDWSPLGWPGVKVEAKEENRLESLLYPSLSAGD